MYGLKGFGLRTLRISLTLFGLGIASSCALISTYVEAPDVEINTVSSTTVLVISAGLWMTGKRLSLQGLVRSRPSSRVPVPGHIDIAITSSNRQNTTCLITRVKPRRHLFRKPYVVHLNEKPKPGSEIRVWHHLAAMHTACASAETEPASSSKQR